MAVQQSVLLRMLQFCGRLWLIWFKVVLCMSFLSILASVVQVAVSQDDMDYDYDGDLDDNMTTCVLSINETNCTDLPANGVCLNCTFNSDCVYGKNTTVECEVPENVTCLGERTFNRTFTCQYCYQLPETDYCCNESTTCNTRQTPMGRYVATCTPIDSVTCLPPRVFERQLPCNYTSGFHWTTAILLSFTLGGFGVDRFYLQLWGSAIGKLISFGGLGVWSILDIILIGTGYVGPADGSIYVY